MFAITAFGELTAHQIESYYRIRFSDFVHFNFGGSKPSLEQHYNWFSRAKEANNYAGFGLLLDDELIGGCSLKNISTLNLSAEFDIFFDSSYAGRGFGKKAMNHLLEEGFKQRKLHRIYAFLLAENTRALALYTKLGFKQEGVLRENVRKGNRFYDSICISILINEYENNY